MAVKTRIKVIMEFVWPSIELAKCTTLVFQLTGFETEKTKSSLRSLASVSLAKFFDRMKHFNEQLFPPEVKVDVK